jgi:hypothetical protein
MAECRQSQGVGETRDCGRDDDQPHCTVIRFTWPSKRLTARPYLALISFKLLRGRSLTHRPFTISSILHILGPVEAKGNCLGIMFVEKFRRT